jgi:hypothetical protein
MTPEKAEILALQALGWLVGEAEDLQKFLNLSGLDVDGLRQAAGTPEMGVAILDYLLGHEDLLLRFCESAEVAPKELHLARHVLGGI